jgi:hypothetical protein
MQHNRQFLSKDVALICIPAERDLRFTPFCNLSFAF